MKIKFASAAGIALYWLLCISPQYAGTAQTGYKMPPGPEYSVFGLGINDAELQQFLSRLGPAIPFPVESAPDLKCICFISDRDETLVWLKFKGSHYAGFKIMSQKKRFYKWHFCEPSAQVSKSILIDNRLRLGQHKDQVKSILGAPQSETGEFVEYVYRWVPQTDTGESADIHRSVDAVQSNTQDPTTITCVVEFSEDKLISLEVSKSVE